MSPKQITLGAWAVAVVVAVLIGAFWLPGDDVGAGSGSTPTSSSPTQPAPTSGDIATPGTTPATTPADQSPGCTKGEVLLQSRALNDDYVALAEKAFQDAAGTSPHCAARGLADVAAVHDQQDAEAAEKLGDTQRRLAATARQQMDDGLPEAAKKTLKELAETGGTTPPDLRESTARPGWWQRYLNMVTPPARTAAEVLVLALVLLLVIVLLARVAMYVAQGVGSSGGDSIQVKPPDGDDGEALAAILADHLSRFNDKDAPVRHARAVLPNEAKFELPSEIGATFAPAGLIASMVTLAIKLLPSTAIKVGVVPLPADGYDGLGVRVSVQSPGGKLDNITLRERHFGFRSDDKDAARLQQLMLPAAVWLAYHPHVHAADQHHPLGTSDWRSYAHFAAGTAAGRRGHAPTAEAQYLVALDRDPSNQGARTNLASLLLAPRAIESQVPGDAALTLELDRLGFAIALLAPVVAATATQPGPAGFQARYLEVVARLHRRTGPDLYEAEEKRKALSALLAAAEIAHLANCSDPRYRDPLLEVRRTLKASIQPLEASIRASSTRPGPASRVWTPVWQDGNTQYNLACLEARRFSESNTSALARQHRDEALRQLQLVLARGDERQRRYAAQDPALTALHPDAVFKALVGEPANAET